MTKCLAFLHEHSREGSCCQDMLPPLDRDWTHEELADMVNGDAKLQRLLYSGIAEKCNELWVSYPVQEAG